MLGARILAAQNYFATGTLDDIVNDRDVLLQATVPRSAPVTNRAILLSASKGDFHISTTGAITPASITFTPTVLGMTGTVAYGASAGATITYAGGVATLNYADLTADSVTVTASITADGVYLF